MSSGQYTPRYARTSLPDRTADSFFVDGCAALHVEVAFLHHADRVVADAVTKLARPKQHVSSH
jgi:hypothetical protein